MKDLILVDPLVEVADRRVVNAVRRSPSGVSREMGDSHVEVSFLVPAGDDDWHRAVVRMPRAIAAGLAFQLLSSTVDLIALHQKDRETLQAIADAVAGPR